MRILADENIPLVEAFFAEFGEIRRQPGRASALMPWPKPMCCWCAR